jgi:NitT/TauT family transport system substrate-binding protein
MARKVSFQKAAVVLVVLALSLMGCGQKSEVKQAEGKPSQEKVKTAPDQMTSVKFGLPSKNTSYLSIYVALQKGFYKKHNLDVTLEYVKGGVLALRGLQTGDLQIINTLPESVITAASEGGNVKFIGAMDNQSMFTVYTTKDINKAEDLKGKAAASNVPGNGTDIQIQYWLKKHGLEPNKDVRLINSGENAGRLQALQTGQAAITILSPPTDLKADELGFKKFAIMREELTTYNHNMLATNGDMIKNKPEVLYAFMAAMGEATQYIKDKANREEMINIYMKEFEMSKADAEKSLDFVLPSLADKGKMNIEGVKWAIDTVKQAIPSIKDVTLEKIVDESFYPK